MKLGLLWGCCSSSPSAPPSLQPDYFLKYININKCWDMYICINICMRSQGVGVFVCVCVCVFSISSSHWTRTDFWMSSLKQWISAHVSFSVRFTVKYYLIIWWFIQIWIICKLWRYLWDFIRFINNSTVFSLKCFIDHMLVCVCVYFEPCTFITVLYSM